jgi:DNA helicase-2/ATP-dependent DNA helicase PcrA
MSATLAAPSEQRILDGLSPAQHAAVVHGEGPLLIIAGAGTGKTTVITRRIAHLIAGKRARPEEILALTFTEKAAVEMAERVDQLIPYGYAESWISTFHAFGDRVLREASLESGLDPDFRVLSRPEQVIFLRERLWRLPLQRFRPLGDPTRHLHALLDIVSRAKDEAVSPEEYLEWAHGLAGGAQGAPPPRERSERDSMTRALMTPEEADTAAAHREIAAFYDAYQRMLEEAGLIDFGDQIHRALAVLRAHPALLASFRERFRYVLVDEFQDTNHAQLELVRLLAGGEAPNITVVGDDDQAIYRWRGAASANLLAFLRLYPGAAQVVLRENYRSTAPILDAASRLVRYNNPYRLEVVAGVDKRLRAAREGGPAVAHERFDTVSAEADGVAAMIEERLQRGFRPRDVAILVRSNGDADPFLRALNVKAIPHRFSGSRGLYDQPEVRLLVCFLRALARPAESVPVFYLAASEVYRLPEAELLRLNHYARRKNRPLLDVLRGLVPAERSDAAWRSARSADASNEDDLAGVSGETRERAARMVADLARAAADVARLRTGEVLYRFLRESGLLARLSREASARAEAEVKNIARFFEMVRAYGAVAEHDRVPAFVEHLELMREAGDDPAVAEADRDEDAVHVLTVHKAKGLEFPVVFIVGCAEERFPVRRRSRRLDLPAALEKEAPAGGDAHLQEERRLFYVAMTRARDELVLTSAADYGSGRPRKVSRFVVEALDLPSPAPVARRAQPLEALARNQPAPEIIPGPVRIPAGRPLRLSFAQMDDYLTCPLKYRYVHVLRVPLLAHHRVVYGSAVHKAVQRYFQARLDGGQPTADDLVAAFRAAWVSEGFLSREHEEERLRAGEEALRRFHQQDSEHPLRPTAVEQEFAFMVGATRVIGRYDLVVQSRGQTSILDFKTGAVDDVHRRTSARVRACSSTCTRWPGCAPRAACPTAWSCTSWSRGFRAPRCRRRTRPRAPRPRSPRSRRRCAGRSSPRALRTWPAASARSATCVPTPRAPPKPDRRPFPRALRSRRMPAWDRKRGARPGCPASGRTWPPCSKRRTS